MGGSEARRICLGFGDMEGEGKGNVEVVRC